MANVTVDSELLYLLDRLPGWSNPHMRVPEDGFTGASHHNVATAAYDVGTKIQVYNHSASAGVDGSATFVYGKLEAQDTTNVLAARHFLNLHSDAVPFDFTNEVATYIGESVSPVVAALGAMTIDYYGWFWCGGVCPEEWVSDLGGVYYCAAAAALGPCTSGDLETPGTTAGEIGLETPDADTDVIVAYLLAAAS